MAKNTLDKVFALQAEILKHQASIEKLKEEISSHIDEVEKVHTANFGPIAAPGFEEKQYVNIRRRAGRAFLCFRNESEGAFSSWLKGKKRGTKEEAGAQETTQDND